MDVNRYVRIRLTSAVKGWRWEILSKGQDAWMPSASVYHSASEALFQAVTLYKSYGFATLIE